MRYRVKPGFTLVELLVVIGIIAVLVGILLPTLASARASAASIKCASNLRSIGQGIAIYLSDNQNTFPASYTYRTIVSGPQPDNPTFGYVHWSSFLIGSNTPAEAFQCPSLENGGLPATNPNPKFMDSNQVTDGSWQGAPYYDLQAPRMAYTLNEAICPRNKFTPGFQGSTPGNFIYHYVKAGQIRNSSDVILGTEFWNDWSIVSEINRGDPDAPAVCKSHRPVHGFWSPNGLDPSGFATAGYNRPDFFHALTKDLYTSNAGVAPPKAGQGSATRLDWVGRNHGTGKPMKLRTNFLYVDGHVETKLLEETLNPFQWGNRFYSLAPDPVVSSVDHN